MAKEVLSTVGSALSSTISTLLGGLQRVFDPLKSSLDAFTNVVKKSREVQERTTDAQVQYEKILRTSKDTMSRLFTGAQLNNIGNALSGSLGGVFVGLGRFLDPLRQQNDAYAAAQRRLQDAHDRTVEAQQKYDKVLKAANDKVKDLFSSEKYNKFQQMGDNDELQKEFKNLFRVSEKEGQAGAEALALKPDKLVGFAAAIGGAIFAITAVIAVVRQLVAKMISFVDALNPTLIQAFNLAIRDLSATIGVAFEPVILLLTNAIRQIAGMLMPVVEELRPIFEELAKVVLSLLIPQMNLLTQVYKAIIPVLQMLVQLFDVFASINKLIISVLETMVVIVGGAFETLAIVLQPLVDVLRILGAIFAGFAEVIHAINLVFGALIKSLNALLKAFFAAFNMSGLVELVAAAFRRLVEIILISVALFARAFGATGFLANLIDALRPQQGATAAMQNVSIRGFEDIGKQLAISSASAAGTIPDANDASLADIVRTLEAIQAGNALHFSGILNAMSELANLLRTLNNARQTFGNVAGGALRGSMFGVVGAAVGAVRGYMASGQETQG